MVKRNRNTHESRAGLSASRSNARWLLLIHQIPPVPGYLRVKVGRRLRRVGAVAIKNSVYALPAGDQAIPRRVCLAFTYAVLLFVVWANRRWASTAPSIA